MTTEPQTAYGNGTKQSQETTTEVNLFFTTPQGFGGHLKMYAATANDAVLRTVTISQWLAKHDFTPSAYPRGGSSAGAAPAASTQPTGGWQSPGKGPACESCGGPTEYKSGTSKKTNKPYSGWFCTRDDKHPPIWG